MKNTKKFIWKYSVFAVALLVYTFAWSAFLLPSKIIGGGVSMATFSLAVPVLSSTLFSGIL